MRTNIVNYFKTSVQNFSDWLSRMTTIYFERIAQGRIQSLERGVHFVEDQKKKGEAE